MQEREEGSEEAEEERDRKTEIETEEPSRTPKQYISPLALTLPARPLARLLTAMYVAGEDAEEDRPDKSRTTKRFGGGVRGWLGHPRQST